MNDEIKMGRWGRWMNETGDQEMRKEDQERDRRKKEWMERWAGWPKR